MLIRVERGGGLAGISISNEMDAKDLPISILQKASKIMENRKTSSVPVKSPPKGSADYYTYKISIKEGKNQSVIECNQFDIEEDLRLLVKYIEKNSKGKNV